MTKKTSGKAMKPSAKPRMADLKPKAGEKVKGGKPATVNTRRQDPYKNFNF